MRNILRVPELFTIMRKKIGMKHKIIRIILYLYFFAFILSSFFRPYGYIPPNYPSLTDFILTFANLIPVRSIANALNFFFESGKIFYLYPLAFNLIVLLPAGILAEYLYEFHGKRLIHINAFLLVIIAITYFLRLLLKRGCFDIDDVILNVIGWNIGIALGYALRNASGRRAGVNGKHNLCKGKGK